MPDEIRKKSPPAAATADAGAESTRTDDTDRSRYRQALDGHPFEKQLRADPNYFFRSHPSFRREIRRRQDEMTAYRENTALMAALDELEEQFECFGKLLLEVSRATRGIR